MFRQIVALVLVLAVPGAASAGPLTEAVERAKRELAQEPPHAQTRSKSRTWTGIALIAGGGVLTTLGVLEVGDDETGLDDGDDVEASDDGEDSDGVGHKAMIGGGIGAAAVGAILLFTGRKHAGPVLSLRPGRVTVRHTFRF